MRIKKGFMLREIVDSWIVVPLGERVVDFNGIMTLTETGAFLWKLMENCNSEDGFVAALLEEYDVDEETARADVSEFINALKTGGVLEE